MRKQNHQGRRGAAAVATVVLLLILDLIVIGIVLGSGRDHDLTFRRIESVQSFYAAEAGLNMGIREIMVCIDEDGDGVVGSISEDTPVNDANDPSIGQSQVIVLRTDDCNTSPTVTLTSQGRWGETMRVAVLTLEHR